MIDSDVMPENPPTPYPAYRLADLENQREGFLHFQLRDILQILALIIVASLFVFQKQSDVSTLTNNLANLTKTVDALVITVDNLKKTTDTNVSDLRLQAERNLDQDRRITSTEQQLITLVPDMREIRTKLNFVADLLNERTKAQK